MLLYVQKSDARVLTHTRPWEHITITLKNIHLLPVHFCIQHKNTFWSLSPGMLENVPAYLSNLLLTSTHSSDTHLLSVPSSWLSTTGDMGFYCHCLKTVEQFPSISEPNLKKKLKAKFPTCFSTHSVTHFASVLLCPLHFSLLSVFNLVVT